MNTLHRPVNRLANQFIGLWSIMSHLTNPLQLHQQYAATEMCKVFLFYFFVDFNYCMSQFMRSADGL